jgi:hypothetical protein
VRGAQGSRRNGLLLLHAFALLDELGRDDGLDGKKVGEVGDRGDVGEVGKLGGSGAFLGD